jgi:hypothetical protein
MKNQHISSRYLDAISSHGTMLAKILMSRSTRVLSNVFNHLQNLRFNILLETLHLQ